MTITQALDHMIYVAVEFWRRKNTNVVEFHVDWA
jgi:hypothetical protein